MSGRSRPYRVDMRYSAPVYAHAIGFNDRCDVAVATVVSDQAQLKAAERMALAAGDDLAGVERERRSLELRGRGAPGKAAGRGAASGGRRQPAVSSTHSSAAVATTLSCASAGANSRGQGSRPCSR